MSAGGGRLGAPKLTVEVFIYSELRCFGTTMWYPVVSLRLQTGWMTVAHLKILSNQHMGQD